jgi:hypothetical protein
MTVVPPCFVHFSPDGTGGVSHSSVLNQEGMELLDNTAELDYLTHVVIRYKIVSVHMMCMLRTCGVSVNMMCMLRTCGVSVNMMCMLKTCGVSVNMMCMLRTCGVSVNMMCMLRTCGGSCHGSFFTVPFSHRLLYKVDFLQRMNMLRSCRLGALCTKLILVTMPL